MIKFGIALTIVACLAVLLVMWNIVNTKQYRPIHAIIPGAALIMLLIAYPFIFIWGHYGYAAYNNEIYGKYTLTKTKAPGKHTMPLEVVGPEYSNGNTYYFNKRREVTSIKVNSSYSNYDPGMRFSDDPPIYTGNKEFLYMADILMKRCVATDTKKVKRLSKLEYLYHSDKINRNYYVKLHYDENGNSGYLIIDSRK